MNIATLIVDDEPAARRRLRMLIETDPDLKIVGECGDGIQAAEMIRNLKPALLFLDVQIPGVDGFGVLKQVTHSSKLPAVIFVTAHREYAIPAFEAQALDYLLKPFKRSRFFEVLARAKAHLRRSGATQESTSEPPQLLLVKSGGRLLFLKMADLKWVAAEGDYVRLHLEDGGHFIRDTMNNFYRRLDRTCFVRTHRSTIVNVNQIRELQPLLGGDFCIILHDKTELTLSRRYRPSLEEILRRKAVTSPRP